MSSRLKFVSRPVARWAWVAVWLCLAATGSAQQPRFSEVTEVLVVEVPVQVLRDGKPVRGLTAADFEIQDGRKKREIVGFDVVDLTISEAADASMPTLAGAARRHFLFLFDLSFSDPGAIVRAREAAIELVRSGLHPTDLAAVATYRRNVGAQLLLSFTPDRQQVESAIQTLALPQLVEAKRDPLGLVLSDIGRVEGLRRPRGGPNLGVDFEAELMELLTQMDTSNRRATDRNEILALTGSLTDLAGMMRSVDGRKYVVFLSEGFNSSILLGTTGSTEEEQRAIEEQNEAAIQGRIWDVDSNTRFGETWSQNQLEEMLQEFVRADCAIEAVDIGGIEGAVDSGSDRSTDDGLFIMADSTGGDFYRNFNNLNTAMTKMLERTSVTYLLAFQPNDVKFDGSFHKLKVKLKDKSAGTQVVHRPGYFAPRSLADLTPVERQLSTASQIFAAPGGQVDTAVLATAFNVGSAMAYVPILIEVDGSSLLIGQRDNVAPVEIYAYAIGSDGQVQDFFAQSLALDLSKVGPSLEQSGLKLWGQFELPPGDYSARVMVRNGSSGGAGVQVFPFTVPDFERTDRVLLAPLFPEPTGKWLLVRQTEAQQGGFDYPFMIDDAPFMPAARPVLHPGEEVQLSLVAYHLAAPEPEAGGSVYDASGTLVRDVDIRLDRRMVGDDPGVDRYAASLAVPELEPGLYRLEVTLLDSGSETVTTSSIALRIAG